MFLRVAWVCKKKDGLKPNPNDSRWVALSVGPEVVNDSRIALSKYMCFFTCSMGLQKKKTGLNLTLMTLGG